MHKKINELEESNLAEKSWQLMGEVSAAKRPENSLMEEVLEYDTTSKPGNEQMLELCMQAVSQPATRPPVFWMGNYNFGRVKIMPGRAFDAGRVHRTGADVLYTLYTLQS